MAELECIPIGAGHGDEGICLWLSIGPYHILCDCGLTTVAELDSLVTREPVQQPPGKGISRKRNTLPIDLVWCSHAHGENARGLWDLHCTYPELPIYTSTITARLLPLNWLDRPDPKQHTFCSPLPLRSRVEVRPGLTITLYPAGHLPGAAIALFSYQHPQDNRDYTVLYSGDFLLSNARLVDGLPLNELRDLRPDVLILEGSFGTARHSHRRQQENLLMQRIYQALQHNRSVVLAVPALGLAQELLVLLRSHHTFTGKNIDIWVDESIAVGCDLYLEMLNVLPESVQNFARHQSLFWDERIRPRMRRLTAATRSQLDQQPCVVLLPAQADLNEFCKSATRPWLILFSEFSQSIQSLQKTLTPPPRSRRRPPVTLETYLLAEHCDVVGTTQLIHNVRPQHVVFIHGNPHNLDDLTSLEELASRYHLHSPRAGTQLEFPLGLIQSSFGTKASATYDGELQEHAQQILISLPTQIREDPRWRSFADTGLIAASWQGEQLVLRGVQQYDLWTGGQQGKISKNVQGCLNCVSYRGQKCWNPQSPLYELRVAPDGYCPSYIPRNEIHDRKNQP
jgi:Cft2 family RNA processing exonuclease